MCCTTLMCQVQHHSLAEQLPSAPQQAFICAICQVAGAGAYYAELYVTIHKSCCAGRSQAQPLLLGPQPQGGGRGPHALPCQQGRSQDGCGFSSASATVSRSAAEACAVSPVSLFYILVQARHTCFNSYLIAKSLLQRSEGYLIHASAWQARVLRQGTHHHFDPVHWPAADPAQAAQEPCGGLPG